MVSLRESYDRAYSPVELREKTVFVIFGCETRVVVLMGVSYHDVFELPVYVRLNVFVYIVHAVGAAARVYQNFEFACVYKHAVARVLVAEFEKVYRKGGVVGFYRVYRVFVERAPLIDGCGYFIGDNVGFVRGENSARSPADESDEKGNRDSRN